MIQVILELLKIGMVMLLSLRTKEAIALRRMPQRKLKLKARRMRLTMSSLLPDQVEMASKDLGNQLMMIILKRNQPQTVNLMLKMSKKQPLNLLSMLEMNLSRHAVVPFNHGWMGAAVVLLSSLMVYLWLLQEVRTILCCLVVHGNSVKNIHLRSSTKCI